MDKIRAAIIGTGGIAHNHLEAVKHNQDNLELIAAANRSPDRLNKFCDQYAITNRYTDFEKLLIEQKPDLVIICTPPHVHRDLCIQSMQAGAHVLCEKPLAASLAEIDDIQAVEYETNRTCNTVLHWRFGAGAQHVRCLIDDKVLGRPMLGAAHTTWYRSQSYYDVDWRGRWDTELGGASTTHGIHAMDFLLWIMGDWEEVYATMNTLAHDIEVEDVATAAVRFSDGAVGTIVNSVVSPRESSYIRLDFTKATVELSHLYHYTNGDWQITPLNAAEGQEWDKITGSAPAHQTSQLAALIQDLNYGRPHLTNTHEVRKLTEFLSSFYQSARTRQPVQRGSIKHDSPFYHKLSGDTS